MQRNAVGVMCLLLVAGVVTACGGTASDNSLVAGVSSSGPLTVQGRVRYLTGAPAANIAVLISGQGPFVSDANGEFVASNAPATYEAIVFDGADGRATVWRGLTRADPVFTVGLPDSPFVLSADVDGTVTGGIGLPVPPTHETQVGFGVEDGVAFGTTNPNNVTGDYVETGLIWSGPAVSTLHATALQYLLDADGLPVDFTGYGTIQAPITAGDDLMNQDIVMGPVATTTVSGSVSAPPALVIQSRLIYLGLPGNGFLFLPDRISLAPSFSLRAPVAPGLTRTLLLTGYDTEGNAVLVSHADLADPTTNLDVTVPAPTGLVLPVAGAAGVGYQTSFQVTPSPGDRVFCASFRPTSGPGPRIRLYTTSSTFRIPNLTAHGMGLPPGVEYTWDVSGLGPASTLDDAAVERTLLFIASQISADGGFTAATATRTFFVAP